MKNEIEQHVWGMTPEGEAIIIYTLRNGNGCEQCHGVANPSTPAKSKSCMKCHNYEDLAAKSKAKKLALNPHDSHAGQLRCTLCHHEHAQSVVYCKQCHIANDARFNFKVP